MALLLNELITNSIKYAFESSKSQNTISVSFERMDKDHYELRYADNSHWKEKPAKTKGFGLELIELPTEQLDGTLERNTNQDGTVYRFELVIK